MSIPDEFLRAADLGEAQDAQALADQIYRQIGVTGSRSFLTERLGPIPIAALSDLVAAAGPGATGPVKVAGVPIQVVVDETLPAGTLEMRSLGHPPVRLVNIAPDVAT